MIAPLQINEDYWLNFQINQKDIENIYNLLLENAIPLPENSILDFLINNKIKQELDLLRKQRISQGKIYLPKNDYKVGETLIFPIFKMEKAKIKSIRDGLNPELQNLKVIDVEFETGKYKSFASHLENHPLNLFLEDQEKKPNLDVPTVKEKYGEALSLRLNEALALNKDLVRIAGSWFLRSLLVDVNIGHLNLAEAVLEEAKGGPITTFDLMKQVELTANADQKLLEFSFDLALQEDGRFDEVGPSGETLWFLKEFEPLYVKEVPVYLQYDVLKYSSEGLIEYLEMFESNIYDELESLDTPVRISDKASISLSFPHWRSGTLPLSKSLKKMFPNAYEAPRVKFTFFGSQENERFSGWVVRTNKYIYGLEKWYQKHNLIPGSLVIVEKSKIPGEIIIRYEKSRQNKEWLKTLLVGSDGGFVFAMLKHSISTSFNERMAIAIPDLIALDGIWKNHVCEKESFEKTIFHVMRELAKLNPQHQVHALELYASVNLFRRCPPSLILFHLLKNEHVEHLGDLYFRIIDKV